MYLVGYNTILDLMALILFAHLYYNVLLNLKSIFLVLPFFVSKCLYPEHPPICDEIEQLCSSVNICCCFVTLKHHHIAVVSFTLCSFYHFDSEFQLVLVMLSSTCNVNYILMGGDFNVNVLVSEDVINKYLNLLADFQLTQHIQDPTRVCDTSATLIDHVISTSSFSISNVKQAVGVSDYRIQMVDFDTPVCRLSHRQCWIRSFKKVTGIKCGHYCKEWHLMDIVLSEMLDMFLPLHVVRSQCSKRPTPWFSDSISQFIASKNKAKWQAEKSGDPDNIMLFFSNCKMKYRLK